MCGEPAKHTIETCANKGSKAGSDQCAGRQKGGRHNMDGATSSTALYKTLHNRWVKMVKSDVEKYVLQ